MIDSCGNFKAHNQYRMNRLDRLNAILIHLQSKPKTELAELEEKYELSRRTIFRDIKALIESGVPIGGDAGEGYFIVEGYHLPPVVFDKEEAAAILIGAKLTEYNADAKTSEAMQSALVKVKAVLRYADKEYLEMLDKNVAILPSPSTMNNGFPDSHLAELQYAIASRRVLNIQYYSTYNNETTERLVEPLGLVHYADRWHLIAYCRLRQDLRDFRTDRIQKPRLTSDQFDPTAHPNYMDFLMENLRGTDAKKAVVTFTKEMARVINDQKYYHGFVEEIVVDSGVQMTFYVNSYTYFAQWLMGFGKFVSIDEPDVLKAETKRLSKELYEHHG
jgi:predicted DNA-binding transcriptional regulator YafY